MTQRGDVRTVPGNQSQSTKAFRALATQGTIGSPARRDAVELSSDFQQGEVVAGLPGRTIQDDTSLRSAHLGRGRPRPNHLGQKEGPKRDRHAACIALYGPMHGTERRVCFCWKPSGRIVTRIAFGRAAYVCGPAYVFQCAVTQHLGIALSALGQGDEFVGDCVFDVIVAVPRAQGDARHFECQTQNTSGLKVEITWAGEIGGDCHSCAPLPCQAGAQFVSQPSVPEFWLLLADR